MRVYKIDGSYVEDNDTEFGWYFYEIIVDEGIDRFEEINNETRLKSKLNKSFPKTVESIDFLSFEDTTPQQIEKIDPDIEIEDIFQVESYDNTKEDYSFEEVDLEFPPKEQLAKLINPCNSETKILLSVVNFPRYRSLIKEETKNKLMQNVNRKSTNFKTLIKDKRTSITEDMVDEIVNYHATKEDTMMSLMMELILTDVDSNLKDIIEEGEKEQLPQFLIETTDTVNSLPNIISNKSENIIRNNYLQVPDRSNILNSLGLSDEDKSIQNLCEETFEMHQELADIKKSFQEDVNKVNDLLKQASDLKNDLRETLYLNDIINLLKGDIDKVKLKKFPFRIFYPGIEEGEREINLII